MRHTFSLSIASCLLFALSCNAIAREELEQIIVTGSRIQSSSTDAPQPITSISAEDFLDSGALTASEALNQLPQLGDALEGGSSINTLNSGFNTGTQTVNLRNLGANRTLVLVNGRRHIGGNVGTSAVDLNSIPTGMIERIDVLTGATSAVYGADAVTGVINVILKSGYEGTDVSLRYGSTTQSDGEEAALALTHGGSFGNGSYLFGLEYSTQEPIVGTDRGFAQFDGSAATGESDANNGSGVNPGGLFFNSALTATGGFDASGSFAAPFAERFQRVPFRYLQNETERLVVSGSSNFDMSDSLGAFVEATFATSTVNVQFEPQLAVFSDAGFASSGTAGFRFPTAATVPVTSLGADLRAITRRFVEFGPRESEIERDLFRFAAGLNGAIGEHTWHVHYQYGHVDAAQIDFDTIDKRRLLTAIDPVACAAASGCEFVDLYGRGTIDPASERWVSDNLQSNSEGEQHVISAYLTGDLAQIGGRTVAYVAGVEWRAESAKIEPHSELIAVVDPVTGSGNLAGLKGTRTFFGRTDGEYDVAEFFAELKVPLAYVFELGFSARFSNYSTVGEEFTFGVSADWQINDAFRARASSGSATRAPNVSELFAPDQAATTAIADPCDTLDDMGNPLVTATNCSSFVPAGYNPTTLDQQIRGVSGGNPFLDSETADTLSVGFVLTPSNSTIFSLDYFDIEMSDVLAAAFGPQATLDRCIATLESFFCDNIRRDPNTSFVTAIRSEQVNLAEQSVAGLELSFSQRWDLSTGSQLVWSGILTHLLEHDQQVNDTAPVVGLVGRVDNIENKFNSSLGYLTDNWHIGFTVRYLGGAVQSVTADPTVATGNSIGSQLYTDIYGSYRITDQFGVRIGIENVTNEESPVVTQLFQNNGSADTTSAGIYDVRGTFWYLSLDYSF